MSPLVSPNENSKNAHNETLRTVAALRVYSGDPRLSKGELFMVGGCVGVVIWFIL